MVPAVMPVQIVGWLYVVYCMYVGNVIDSQLLSLFVPQALYERSADASSGLTADLLDSYYTTVSLGNVPNNTPAACIEPCEQHRRQELPEQSHLQTAAMQCILSLALVNLCCWLMPRVVHCRASLAPTLAAWTPWLAA
jgi:hypothetical protein